MKNCVWVKPELVVEIEFDEWTPDGHLRHSKFIGLREDKDPHDVGKEAEHQTPTAFFQHKTEVDGNHKLLR